MLWLFWSTRNYMEVFQSFSRICRTKKIAILHHFRVDDYTSDLRSLSANDRFSSCCFYGIWNLFADQDYNDRNQNVSQLFVIIYLKLQLLKWIDFRLLLIVLGEKDTVKISEEILLLMTRPVQSGKSNFKQVWTWLLFELSKIFKSQNQFSSPFPF